MTAEHVLCLTLPVRIESEANRRDHWAEKARRVKMQRNVVRWSLTGRKPPALPCTVRLVRVGPRDLDLDNLIGGGKAIRDQIAEWLGVDDADPRVTWEYAQQRGQAGVYETVLMVSNGVTA